MIGLRAVCIAVGVLLLPACSDEFASLGIGLSSTQLTFTAIEGGPDPADQTVDLTNIGKAGSALLWTATADQPWLSVIPSSGAGPATLSVKVDSLVHTEAWVGPMSTTGAPTNGSGRGAWVGDRLLVWGDNLTQTGVFYDPVGDAWSGSTTTTGAPSTRILFSSEWTGKEFIIWGGLTFWGGTALNTGARYDPAADSWAPMSTTGAPSARFAHTAVWTGTRMIVWGGDGGGFSYTNTGAAYDPATDTWNGTTTLTGAPPARGYHAAVWTGTRMIVWGGENPGKFDTGALYDPAANAWTGTTTLTGALSARSHLSAVWTGREMILWGGGSGGPHLDTGARYNPATDTWTGALPSTGAPAARASHVMAWSGTQMIVWGGESNGAAQNTGVLYQPPELPQGSYAGTITFSAPGAVSRKVTVDLRVDP